MASSRSGALSLNTSITSPLEGALPGQGDNFGLATVQGTYTLKRAVKSLPVTATVRIDSALATHSGVLFTNDPKGSETGFAGASLELTMTVFDCSAGPGGFSCFGYRTYMYRDLVNAASKPSMGRSTITLRGTLRPPSFFPGAGSTIRPGKIGIGVSLVGGTQLGGCANAMCYAPDSLPEDCEWDAGGCVLALGFPNGCVDSSCAVPLPYGCVDPDCNLTFPPFVCAEFTCVPPPTWCVVSPWCLSPVGVPASEQLADTGTARVIARGAVTGIWVG